MSDPNSPSEGDPLRAELLQVLAEEARRTAGSPVEPEELVAYLEGTLEPEDQRRVHRHVISDPETARQLLDLNDLLAAETGQGAESRGVADFATEAGWRDLESRLDSVPEGATHEGQPADSVHAGSAAAGSSHADSKLSRSQPTRTRLTPSSLRLWQSAAALGLVLSAFLGVRALFGPSTTSTTAGPQPAVTLDLVADLRGPGGPATVTVPEGARLHLEISPTERCATYEIEVAGPNGKATSLALTPNERGALVLGLAGEPGAYLLRLSGCDPPRDIEQHRFRVERPDGASTGDGA